MAIMIVTYDLRKPDRDYKPLYDYLESLTYCWHIESVWMLDTNLSCAEIRDGMKGHMHEKDRIFVAQLQKHWSAFNYDCSEWLKDASRNW